MSRRARRNQTPGFKAKVALAAIKGDRTLAQIAEQFDVHPNQVTSWKAQCRKLAISHCSRNQLPNPATANGFPKFVTKKVRWPLGVASSNGETYSRCRIVEIYHLKRSADVIGQNGLWHGRISP